MSETLITPVRSLSGSSKAEIGAVRAIQFCEVSCHLNDKAKLSSNETRIQDFYTESEINYFSVAVLLISLLPKDQKLRLGINPNGMGFWHLPGQYSNDFSGAANLVQSKK